MPLRMELPGPSAAGARRVERWLNTLPGAVALRSANAAPGLSLSASQPELAKTRACTPIETRVTLAGGAHGDASATIRKPIAEVVERDVVVALQELQAVLVVRQIARAPPVHAPFPRPTPLASRGSLGVALCLTAVRPLRAAAAPPSTRALSARPSADRPFPPLARARIRRARPVFGSARNAAARGLCARRRRDRARPRRRAEPRCSRTHSSPGARAPSSAARWARGFCLRCRRRRRARAVCTRI